MLSITSAFSGVSVWTLGEKKKNKYDALSNEKGDEKSVLYVYCRFHQRFRAFRCGRFVKRKNKYDALSNENALVCTGERLENTSLGEKLFCFVFFKMKTGTSENYGRGFTLVTYPGGTPD